MGGIRLIKHLQSIYGTGEKQWKAAVEFGGFM